MAVPRPYLPDLALPLHAATRYGELVRIRHLVPGEPRVDSASEYDDWGPFDLEFDDSEHGRAMIEVRAAEDPVGPWTPVGDMSWHSELHGPNLGSRALAIGLSLAVSARGRGIGTVAQSLLAIAAHRAGVHRVQASTDPTNIAEQHALAAAGFVREGIARGAQLRADGRHDLVLYGCLPGEPTTQPSQQLP
jgi:RimJ/RimL family protein N-acetyltransferase